MTEDFNSVIKPGVLDLLKRLLGEDGIKETNDITRQLLLSEESKERVIKNLRERMGLRPKRPMFYLNHELNFLPEYTRDVVRYAGDYIDQLVKALSGDKGVWFAEHRSLGFNLMGLRNMITKELLDNLIFYNKNIYVPAKHDFNVADKPHLFSAKDAVAVCLITLKLSKEIIALSDSAKAYSER